MDSQNLKELAVEGYTIVKNALNEQEVEQARDYFWDWLEDLGSGIDRDDLETWSDENWPGNVYTGFIGNHGISQSQFVWYLRSHPNVRDAFLKIWSKYMPKDNKQMLASMDAVICWRPWWYCDFEDWEPKVEELHCDQNPINKEGFWCVQGMIPLYDVTDISGGLQVIPRTHTTDIQDMIKEHTMNYMGDYVTLPESFTSSLKYKPSLILAKAGDLILWDSRLIHGGKVGKGQPIVGLTDPEKQYDLLRLAVPICLMPRIDVSKDILDARREAFVKRYTMNHWANEMNYFQCSDSHAINIKKEPVVYQLTKVERELL